MHKMENRGSLWYNAEQVMTLRMNGARQSVNHSEKKMAHYHFYPDYLSSTSYMLHFCHCSVNTESFFTTGAISARFMALRQTAFGEAGVSAAVTMIHATCWR